MVDITVPMHGGTLLVLPPEDLADRLIQSATILSALCGPVCLQPSWTMPATERYAGPRCLAILAQVRDIAACIEFSQLNPWWRLMTGYPTDGLRTNLYNSLLVLANWLDEYPEQLWDRAVAEESGVEWLREQNWRATAQYALSMCVEPA